MQLIKNIIPKKIKLFLSLSLRFYHDFRLFYIYSSVIKKETFGKIESEITLRYHSIEKGFLYNPTRPRFAKKRIEELIILMKNIEFEKYGQRVQIQSALLNLCKYYEFHLDEGTDISDYYKREEYDIFKQQLKLSHEPIKYHTKKSFFKYKNSDFINFSISRASVRNFTGEKIANEVLQKAVDLANYSPSVCNRQPVNVHIVDNKNKIDRILEIQGGLKGYSNSLYQLIVITSDRNYFYTTGERNQLYIDGGIYLMNLLYALHFYGIGACPAHWGLPYHADKRVKEILKLKPSEQVISLVAIGVPTDEFPTTLSLRKSSNENLYIHS